MTVLSFADPEETQDLAAERPDDVARLKAALEAWQESVRRSNEGADVSRDR